MTKSQQAVFAFLAAAVVLTLGSGCGGSVRPSVDEISSGVFAGFAGTDTSPELVECMSRALHDSDLSDAALRAVADHDEDYRASPTDQATLDRFASVAARACAEATDR